MCVIHRHTPAKSLISSFILLIYVINKIHAKCIKLYVSCLYQVNFNHPKIGLKYFFTMKHENRTPLHTTTKQVVL